MRPVIYLSIFSFDIWVKIDNDTIAQRSKREPPQQKEMSDSDNDSDMDDWIAELEKGMTTVKPETVQEQKEEEEEEEDTDDEGWVDVELDEEEDDRPQSPQYHPQKTVVLGRSFRSHIEVEPPPYYTGMTDEKRVEWDTKYLMVKEDLNEETARRKAVNFNQQRRLKIEEEEQARKRREERERKQREYEEEKRKREAKEEFKREMKKREREQWKKERAEMGNTFRKRLSKKKSRIKPVVNERDLYGGSWF